MKTKEAIEKLNYGSGVFKTNSIFDINILELIELLRHGEKVERLIKENKELNVKLDKIAELTKKIDMLLEY